MADDFYPSSGGDAGAEASPTEAGSETVPPPADGEGKEGQEEQKPEGETALLPKSILAGKEFKPGEEVIFKVVHIYDDEVEVEYAKGEGGEHDESMEHEDNPEAGESPMDKATNKLKSMATGGY